MALKSVKKYLPFFKQTQGENMSEPAISPTEAILSFKIDNKQPVELIDLTESFTALAEQYKRFLIANPELPKPDDPKLYVKSIRTGSIEAEIVEFLQFAIPFTVTTVNIIELSKHLKTIFEYFSGKINIDKPKLEKTDYEQLTKIVAPVAKDNASQLIVSASQGGKVVVNFNADSQATNAMQNRWGREIKNLKKEDTGFQEKKLLYWHKTKNTQKKESRDWAIIESIDPKPVKTIFQNDGDKIRVLNDPLYAKGYIVDVVIETIQGIPSLYKITNILDTVPHPLQAKEIKTDKKKKTTSILKHTRVFNLDE